MHVPAHRQEDRPCARPGHTDCRSAWPQLDKEARSPVRQDALGHLVALRMLLLVGRRVRHDPPQAGGYGAVGQGMRWHGGLRGRHRVVR